MSRSNAYFMERMEADADFRREVELAELRHIEPELSAGDEDKELYRQEAQETFVEPVF